MIYRITKSGKIKTVKLPKISGKDAERMENAKVDHKFLESIKNKKFNVSVATSI